MSERPRHSRLAVLEAIARHGEASAEDVAVDVVLSVSAARQQLVALMAEGLVSHRRVPEGRGRPRNLYRLTPAGEQHFPQAAEWLLLLLLSILWNERPDALAYAQQRMGDQLETAYNDPARWPAIPRSARLRRYGAMLAETGFANTADDDATIPTLCITHCSLAAVARQFPRVCDVEHHFIERILKVRAVRTQSRIEGSAVCVYEVPRQTLVE